MSRHQTLSRSSGGETPSHRESLWCLPRAPQRLVILAAEVQDGIDLDLPPEDCFELSRQYWLQIHQRLHVVATDRFKDNNYRRLPSVDKQIIDQLDQSKLDFMAGLAHSWHQVQPETTVLAHQAAGESRSSSSHDQPWPRRSLSDTRSRLRHRLNLAIDTDYSHLWSGWLVSSGYISSMQVGYDNYKTRIAELQESAAETRSLADSVREGGQLAGLGPGETLIEKQLKFLGRHLANGVGLYEKARQR